MSLFGLVSGMSNRYNRYIKLSPSPAVMAKMRGSRRKRDREVKEIERLECLIEYGKPESGSDPLCFDVGCKKFSELPLSEKTKRGLAESKFIKMTRIQRVSLPHALCGRDIIGASKTGSGKSLAFIIPVLEKLHRMRWGPEDGIGSIIMSPTRELAYQLFELLSSVGKHHSFSAGLVIGGCKDVEAEKEYVHELNILVCTPGRLLHHMNATPNFDCSQLQILVLDEADRVLGLDFQKVLDSIISQLPKHRQTLLFSATLTNSIKGLGRVGLRDPEYLNVDQESATATPARLMEYAIIVPLEQKLDFLWSFIKANLNKTILVFFSTCKQVKFTFESFKKLRPGIPLSCLYGRMKLERRMAIYSQFCLRPSVLFATDVAARGLEFNKPVDIVVQVDCPENFKDYQHRVGRTARNCCTGESILFLMPSEIKMLEKLQQKRIPLELCTKSTFKCLQAVSGLVAAILVKYVNLQFLAQRAFITYLKSVYIKQDKEVFDVMKLPIEEFAASLGLPMTPKIRFLKKVRSTEVSGEHSLQPEIGPKENLLEYRDGRRLVDFKEDEVDDALIIPKEISHVWEPEMIQTREVGMVAKSSKRKKLKIDFNRPTGTRTCFDDEGNGLPPLARLADVKSGNRSFQLDTDLVNRRYAKMREAMKQCDKEDKLRYHLLRKEMKCKHEMKQNMDGQGYLSESGQEANKRMKVYFHSDSDSDDLSTNPESISLAEQEKLALKVLSSMRS